MNLDSQRIKPQKKSANLSISIDLLQIAKEDNLNLLKCSKSRLNGIGRRNRKKSGSRKTGKLLMITTEW